MNSLLSLRAERSNLPRACVGEIASPRTLAMTDWHGVHALLMNSRLRRVAEETATYSGGTFMCDQHPPWGMGVSE